DHDAGAQLCRRDPASVVRVIADFLVGLIACAHIGADTAIVEHLGGSAQNRADEALAIQRFVVAAKRGPRFETQFDSLLVAAPYAATLADQRGVIVRPLRARLVVKPLAF